MERETATGRSNALRGHPSDRSHQCLAAVLSRRRRVELLPGGRGGGSRARAADGSSTSSPRSSSGRDAGGKADGSPSASRDHALISSSSELQPVRVRVVDPVALAARLAAFVALAVALSAASDPWKPLPTEGDVALEAASRSPRALGLVMAAVRDGAAAWSNRSRAWWSAEERHRAALPACSSMECPARRRAAGEDHPRSRGRSIVLLFVHASVHADLVPSDITGVSIYDSGRTVRFRRVGPREHRPGGQIQPRDPARAVEPARGDAERQITVADNAPTARAVLRHRNAGIRSSSKGLFRCPSTLAAFCSSFASISGWDDEDLISDARCMSVDSDSLERSTTRPLSRFRERSARGKMSDAVAATLSTSHARHEGGRVEIGASPRAEIALFPRAQGTRRCAGAHTCCGRREGAGGAVLQHRIFMAPTPDARTHGASVVMKR